MFISEKIYPSKGDIQPYYDPAKHEIGLKIGFPILSNIISKISAYEIKDNKGNEIKVHNFRLNCIKKDGGIEIDFSVQGLNQKDFDMNAYISLVISNGNLSVQSIISVTNEAFLENYLRSIGDYVIHKLADSTSSQERPFCFIDELVNLYSSTDHQQEYLNKPTLLEPYFSKRFLSYISFAQELSDLMKTYNIHLSKLYFEPQGIWFRVKYLDLHQSSITKLIQHYNISSRPLELIMANPILSAGFLKDKQKTEKESKTTNNRTFVIKANL